MENITKAPSLVSSKVEMDDTGMDSFTEHKDESLEPLLDEWEVGNKLRPPKKNKKRYPGTALWE